MNMLVITILCLYLNESEPMDYVLPFPGLNVACFVLLQRTILK